jgi:hypothetical protein
MPVLSTFLAHRSLLTAVPRDVLNYIASILEDRIRSRSVFAVFWIAVLSAVETHAQVNVTQEHNNPSRNVNHGYDGPAPRAVSDTQSS